MGMQGTVQNWKTASLDAIKQLIDCLLLQEQHATFHDQRRTFFGILMTFGKFEEHAILS